VADIPGDLYEAAEIDGASHFQQLRNVVLVGPSGCGKSTTVEVIEPMGSESYIYFRTGDTTFISRVDAHRKFRVGEQAEPVVFMDKAQFLPFKRLPTLARQIVCTIESLMFNSTTFSTN
jgi:ABC-type glutathione transport system ATPase component